eukprot:Gb_07351 [translate_table: standard]
MVVRSLFPINRFMKGNKALLRQISSICNDSTNANTINPSQLNNFDLCELANKYQKNVNKCQHIISIAEAREGGIDELLEHMKLNEWKMPGGSFTPLLYKYCKSGKLCKALELYHHPAFQPDFSAFEILIMDVSKRGEWKQALTLHEQMQQAGFEPTAFTFSSLIRGALKVGNLDIALKAFYSMRDHGLLPDLYAFNSLVTALCKSNRQEYAHKIFYELRADGFEPNVVTYSTLIGGWCRMGSMKRALNLFAEMKQQRCYGNDVTYSILIHGYLKIGEVHEAYCLYKEMRENSIVPNAPLASTLWSALFKADRGEEMWKLGKENGAFEDVFAGGQVEKVVSFVKKTKSFSAELYDACVFSIVKFIHSDKVVEATEVFRSMRDAGWVVEEGLCAMLISALSKSGQICEAERLYEESKSTNLAGIQVYSNFLVSLLHSKRLDAARQVLDEMEKKSLIFDGRSYEFLVVEFNKAECVEDAYALYLRWGHKGSLSSHQHLVRALSNLEYIDKAWEVYKDMQMKGHSLDHSTYRTLLDGLCRSSSVDQAYELYKEMVKRNVIPDTGQMNRLMKVVCMACQINKAWEIFHKLESTSSDSVISYGILIQGLMGSRRISEALDLLETMKMRGHEPSLIIYNTIIRGLSLTGQFEKTDDILAEITQQGLRPDAFTYCSLIDGLCKAEKFDAAIWIFEEMQLQDCHPDVPTYTALILGLSRAGRVFKALRFFHEMKRKGLVPLDSVYKHLVSSLENRGALDKANELWQEMTNHAAETEV